MIWQNFAIWLWQFEKPKPRPQVLRSQLRKSHFFQKCCHFRWNQNKIIEGSILTQGCILLTSLSVISSKFIQKFAQKCQYFTLIDQSVPPDNCYVTCLLREESALYDWYMKPWWDRSSTLGRVLQVVITTTTHYWRNPVLWQEPLTSKTLSTLYIGMLKADFKGSLFSESLLVFVQNWRTLFTRFWNKR